MAKAEARDCWISEPGFRHYYTDENGIDHDIVKAIADLRMARVLLGAGECPDSDCDEGIVYRDIVFFECGWCAEKKELLKCQ